MISLNEKKQTAGRSKYDLGTPCLVIADWDCKDNNILEIRKGQK